MAQGPLGASARGRFGRGGQSLLLHIPSGGHVMLRRLYPDQPESFAFTDANLAWAEAQMTKYPAGRQASAVIPLLWRAQEQEGWLSRPAIEYVAKMLDINPNMIGRWVKEHQQDDDGQAFRGNGKLTPDQAEIRRLKAQVKQLEMEKRILKKEDLSC